MLVKIKTKIEEAIEKANLPIRNFTVEKSKDLSFGDFSSNVAMILSKECKKNPLDIANEIISHLNKEEYVEVSVSKPGFINFRLNDNDKKDILNQIITEENEFPKFKKTNKFYNIEFVSANPTGYLHIGHARNAVFGDTINRLFNKIGIKTLKEYLVNDSGNQMNRLAYSTLIRYKQLFDIDIDLCDDSYHGSEIILIAKKLKEEFKDKFVNTKITNNAIDDKEVNDFLRRYSCKYLLSVIKDDLLLLDIKFDLFFSENDDHEKDAIQKILKKLSKYTYEKDGAIWLKTTLENDDKDRVLVKSDGVPTYFLPDIIYHEIKATRNHPDKIINIWGADHHSYIVRMKVALKFLGFKDDIMDVICMQMVRLIKNGQEFKLSKRTGNSLTLKEMVEILGKDPMRWFLLSSYANSHIDIDIDLALLKDSKNPIFYVQYAHARICTLLKKNDSIPNEIDTCFLNLDSEKELINQLIIFKSTIEYSAKNYEPSKLCNYLLLLAKLFHNYYSNVNILSETNENIKNQRIILIKCIKQVLFNGLTLLGITPSEKM